MQNMRWEHEVLYTLMKETKQCQEIEKKRQTGVAALAGPLCT